MPNDQIRSGIFHVTPLLSRYDVVMIDKNDCFEAALGLFCQAPLYPRLNHKTTTADIKYGAAAKCTLCSLFEKEYFCCDSILNTDLVFLQEVPPEQVLRSEKWKQS